MSAQAPILAVAKPDHINIWQLEPRVLLRQIPFAAPVMRVTPDGPILPMALSPGGTTLAVGGERLHLFDLAQDSDPQVLTHNVALALSLSAQPGS